MSTFPKATDKFDPFGSFKFRLKFGDDYVAAFTEISALTTTTQSTSNSFGQASFPAITLKRGAIYNQSFADWCNQVWDYNHHQNADPALTDFRKTLIIEMYDETGEVKSTFSVINAWPGRFEAFPSLNNTNQVETVQYLVLENEGFIKS